MDVSPNLFLLNNAQLYYFYDQGVIWNIRHIPTVLRKQSAASTGIGSRFLFTKNLSGNVMFTQPLTRQVAAEELIGNGRKPRIFFNITLTDA